MVGEEEEELLLQLRGLGFSLGFDAELMAELGLELRQDRAAPPNKTTRARTERTRAGCFGERR